MSDDFAVLVVYHLDVNEGATAVVGKNRSKKPMKNLRNFFEEGSDLEDEYSLVPIDELLATRVVVLTGSMRNLF